MSCEVVKLRLLEIIARSHLFKIISAIVWMELMQIKQFTKKITAAQNQYQTVELKGYLCFKKHFFER
jgi:hypothetical protein